MRRDSALGFRCPGCKGAVAAHSEAMSESNPDPEPRSTPGLEPGGGVPPGETPPGESGISETGPRETHNPARGWAVAPLAALFLVVVLVLGFFIAYAVVV